MAKKKSKKLFRSGSPPVIDYTPISNRSEGVPVYTGGAMPGEPVEVLSVVLTEAHKAHSKKNFANIDPLDHELLELVARIESAPGRVNKTAIAREITHESIQDCPRAKALCGRHRLLKSRPRKKK